MKKFILLYFALILSLSAGAQVLSGPEDVCSGKDYTYTYADDVQYNSVNWSVTGGTVMSGTGLSRVIRWNANGRVIVTLYWNGVVRSTLTRNVSIFSAGSIAGPSVVCKGSTAVFSASGYNADGTTLNWQSSVDGINFSTLSATGASLSVSPLVVTWYRAMVGSCSGAVSNVIKLTPQALPVPTFAATPSSVCAGTTGHLYTTQAGMSNYVWTVSSGGTITAGGTGTSNSVTVTWTTAGARSVSVNYKANGCTAVSPTVKVVKVSEAIPSFTVGPTSTCVGATGSLYTTQIGMSNYVWTVSPGGKITSGGTTGSNTATVTWTGSGAQSIKVSYTNSVGCVASSAATRSVNVNPLPVPTFTTSPASVCAGSNGYTYTTQSGMSNYIWTASGGGVIANPGGSSAGVFGNTISVTWSTAGAKSVSVSYTTASGCISAVPAVAAVTVSPIPSPTFSAGPTSICAGSTNVYATQSGMSNYVWTLPEGGTIVSGGTSTSNTIGVVWSSPGGAGVTVNYTANGCTSATRATRNVTVNPLPVPTLTSGPTTVCQGSSGNVYTTQAGGNNYAWTVAGGTITSGITSNAVAITWNTSGAKTVKVNYSNAAGCTATSLASMNVTVNTLPAPTFTSAPTTVCLGSGNVYTTQPGMSNYNWVVSSGGAITAGGGPSDNSATVKWTTAGARSISVAYTNSYGCVATTPAVANVTVNAIPSPGFTSGPTSACAGSTGNIYTTQAGMTNYVWSVSAGGTVTAGGTSASSTITISWSSAGNRSVSVNYSSNGCMASQPAVRNVVVYAVPAPTITGPVSSCAGSSGNVYVTQSGMTNYTWSVSPGGTITSGGSGTNTATIAWNSAGAGTVRVNYSNSGGCTATSPASFAVTINNLPSPTFTTGPVAVCAGSAGNIYATQAGMTNYLWTVSTGGTITAGGSTTNNSVTVTWGSAGSRSVALRYTNANGCTAAAPVIVNVTVNSLPLPTFTSGPTSACVQSADNLYVTQPGMSNYVWTVSTGGVVTSGGGTSHNTVKVTWTTAGTRSVSVRYTDPNSCAASSAVVRNVTVNGLPNPTFTSGPATVCVGSATYVTTSGMSNYVWNVSSGGTITAGGTTNAATVNWHGTGNQTISVSYTAAGCQPVSPAVRNVAVSSPSVGGEISPAIAEHYSVSNSGSFTLADHTGNVLRWERNSGSGWVTVNHTAEALNYQDVNQVTAFRAVVRNGVCPEATSASAQVMIYTAPVVVASQEYIPYGGSSLLSVTPGYNSFRWYRNDAVIEGASEESYAAREPGKYKVEAKAEGATGSAYSQVTVVTSSLDRINLEFENNRHSVTSLLLPGVTPSTNLFALDPGQVRQNILYKDGLGRPLQAVSVGQSPMGFDLVQPTDYDRHGLQDTAYLPYTTGAREGLFRRGALRGNGESYISSEQRKYYQTSNGVAHDEYPYAVSRTAASPLMNLKEQGAPGFDWQLEKGHTVKYDVMLNDDNQVRLWKPDGTSSSYYPADVLVMTEMTDEDGRKVQTFTDKAGSVVLRRVEADGNLEGLSWLETYHVYDEFGRIKWQVSPKAVALLDTDPSLDADSIVAELVFRYTYDARGRLIEKKVPGSRTYSYVYDKLDRLVLTNESQVDPGSWIFTKFDDRGRVALMGHRHSGTKTRDVIQAELDSIDYDAHPWYESELSGTSQGYSDLTYPISGEPLVVNYYDHYDFDRDGIPDYTYDSTHLEGQEKFASTRTRGLLTGRKTRVVDEYGLTSKWLWTAIFYDGFDRPVQVQSNNIQFTGATDKRTTVFDFVRPLRTKSTHHSTPTGAIDIVDRAQTDHAGRVLRVYRQINDNDEQLIAAYSYNELGQVISRQLHETPDGGYLQTVDYSYTIRGWLERINNPDAPGDDFFAQQIFYNGNLDVPEHKPMWNGSITASTWTEGLDPNSAEGQNSFLYAFTKNGQLKDATYTDGTNSINGKGALDEHLRYDSNGNIQALVRNGKNEIGAVVTIDSLLYSYRDESRNQLTQVEDASHSDQGFRNGATSPSEMQYDEAGNLTMDENKGISDISYNILNKVSRVKFLDGREIRYSYDASGAKLSADEYQGPTHTRATSYAGSFVYENDELQFFGSPEGRVVVKDGVYEFQYSIGDHQGNTRIVFTSTRDSIDFLATFESDGLRADTDLFDGIEPSHEVSFGGANHTAGGSKVYRMNQENPVGVAVMLRVYPGDEVDPEVWAYHESNTGYGANNMGIAAMVAAVAGSFGGLQGTDGGGPIYDAFAEGLGILGFGGNRGNTKPAAYLNYIFFDDAPGFDPENQHDGGGWEEVPDGAYFNKALVKFDEPIRIAKPGYIYIYLSYENQSDNYVYFDDLRVNYRKSPVIQSSSYYAYGMLSPDSWTRYDAAPNKYLYNGGSELNEGTGNYEMFFRSYDPALGRMNGVDIRAAAYSSLTPYNYAFNNPVYWNDPNGADPLTSERGGFSYGSMGGCNCWRDRGAQDYGGEARGGVPGGAFRVLGDATKWGRLSGESEADDVDIDMNALADGAYLFTFRKGRVTSSNYLSDDDIALLGGATSVAFRTIVGLNPLGESDYVPGGRLWGNTSGSLFAGASYTSSVNVFAGQRRATSPGRIVSRLEQNNYIVKAIHDGAEAFSNHPFGGGLLSFLSGAPMGGLFTAIRGAIVGAKSLNGAGRVFWAGGEKARQAAAAFAKSIKGTTIGETRAGQNLANLIQQKNIPWDGAGGAREMWARLSAVYARGASSPAYFIPGSRISPQSIWFTVEKPILENRGITIITPK
jgi:RHS repeat-associated protein